MAGPVSGKDGSVSIGSETLNVRSFSVDVDPNLIEYASSATAGHKQRKAGVKDWTATVEVYAEDGGPFTVDEGTEVTATFTLASGKTLSGAALVGAVSYEVDVEEGGLVSATMELGANGPLS